MTIAKTDNQGRVLEQNFKQINDSRPLNAITPIIYGYDPILLKYGMLRSGPLSIVLSE